MKTIAVVPTYDERENVGVLVEAFAALGGPSIEVLFVDDGSPDGTARRVETLARSHPFADVLRRTGPRGRGHAVREGYLRALERGADRILEMDADLSHHPRDVPALVAACDDADMAIGSRAVPGGRDVGRARWRRALTTVANLYVRTVLGVPVRDPDAGFRCFRRECLERIDPISLRAGGPASVQETLFRAHRAGARIREVPIELVDRRAGGSKLAWRQLLEVASTVLALRLREALGRGTRAGRTARSSPAPGLPDEPLDEPAGTGSARRRRPSGELKTNEDR